MTNDLRSIAAGVLNPLATQPVMGVLILAAAFWVPASPSAADDTPPVGLSLTGRIRDFPPASLHPDFTEGLTGGQTGHSIKNIATSLDGEHKPLYTGEGRRVSQQWKDAAGRNIAWCVPAAEGDVAGTMLSSDAGVITSASTFNQWFRDVPGVNMSRLWTIKLDPVDGGNFAFTVENFHPIDEQLLGNGPDEHNFYFTYELVCEFTYDADASQFFQVQGDDDVWVFINNQLVIDHGGVVAAQTQRIDLNRLGLTDAQTYQLHFFLAERKQPQSQFGITTNISSLRTASGNDSVFAACD